MSAQETTWDGVPKFSVVDYVFFGGMLGTSLLLGLVSIYCSRTSSSPREYLQATGSLPAPAVLLSLLGGSLSAISVLGYPAETYFFGTQMMTCFLGFFFACALIYFIILPTFFTLKIISIDEYLELRYGSPVLRWLACLCQLLNLLFMMGIVMYAPSIALSTVTRLSSWASTLIVGTVCTVYTTLGGVRAVVWTDVLQTLLMLVGVLLVVVVCLTQLDNADQVWTIAEQGSRISFFNMDPSPFVRHTFWSTIVFGFYMTLFFFGVNQSTFQRFSSLKSLELAQRVCFISIVGWIVLWSIFLFSGIVAYAVYHDCDPLSSGKITKPDQILPYLVMDRLGNMPGLPGVFMSAVYGAVLSTVSTFSNSVACLIWEDFLKGLPFFNRLSIEGIVIVLKILSFLAGVTGLVVSQVVGGLGNISQVANMVVSSVYSPLIGIYLAGILTPWVSCKGAVSGFIASFGLNLWMMVGSLMYGNASPTPLSLSTSGCNDTLVIGSTLKNTSTLDQTRTQNIYDISYCYSGMLGVVVTLLVSSFVSLVTGVVKPWTLKTGVVAPRFHQFYKFLWRMLRKEQEEHEMPMTSGI